LEIKPKVLTELSAYPFPKSKKGVQSFLGSLNYYGKFIQDFGVLAATLYEIQDEDFTSGQDLSRARRSFDLLKERAVSAPVLKHFQTESPVYIMLFANEWAISATVMQLHEGKYHPVRFVSRVLKQNELGYHLAEKEVLALLRVLRVCYTMLTGRELSIFTRYSTLKWLYTQRSLYGRALQFAVMLSLFFLGYPHDRESKQYQRVRRSAGSLPVDQDAVWAEERPNVIPANVGQRFVGIRQTQDRMGSYVRWRIE
jgi:hypothetical protein